MSRALTGVIGVGLAALLCGAVDAQVLEGFNAAKILADRDEAGLSPAQKANMQSAQSRQLDAVVADCASPNPDTSAFIVVAELDARGKIARTWRQGDTALARCVEGELTGRFLEPPPRAPFHVSFELSFSR